MFPISSESVQIWQCNNDYCKFKMAAAVILAFDGGLPVLTLSDRGYCIERVFQSSSRSIYIWPSYCDFRKIKMAAAAILVFDVGLPVSILSDRDVVGNVYLKFHQDRSIFDRVIVIFINSRWRPPPSWFPTMDFRFRYFPMADVVLNVSFKFHQER